MDLKEAIYSRRAVREYTAEPVDEKTIRELIDAAIQAPSAVNQQPWSFCVVRDQAVLARISSEAKAHMLRTSPAALLPHFQERLSNPAFNIFYHAPVLVLISSATESPWAVENCSLAAENLMLAARAAGLGTCWIGFAQKWLEQFPLSVNRWDSLRAANKILWPSDQGGLRTPSRLRNVPTTSAMPDTLQTKWKVL
jgi:nitroreductase